MQEWQEEEWKGIELNTIEMNHEWLHDAMVGWVKDPQRIILIQEAIIIEGLKRIRMQYLGDNMVLLPEMEKGRLKTS